MTRIFHPWTEWECYRAGFYGGPEKRDPDEARSAYRDFLADIPRFDAAMSRVVAEWPNSCEQFLTNHSINRVAWMGQAAMCIATGIPSRYRAGFALLDREQQRAANAAAAARVSAWESARA